MVYTQESITLSPEYITPQNRHIRTFTANQWPNSLAASYPGVFFIKKILSLNPVLYTQMSDKDSEPARVLGEDGEGLVSLSLICVYNTGLSDNIFLMKNVPGYKTDTFCLHGSIQGSRSIRSS